MNANVKRLDKKKKKEVEFWSGFFLGILSGLAIGGLAKSFEEEWAEKQKKSDKERLRGDMEHIREDFRKSEEQFINSLEEHKRKLLKERLSNSQI